MAACAGVELQDVDILVNGKEMLLKVHPKFAKAIFKGVVESEVAGILINEMATKDVYTRHIDLPYEVDKDTLHQNMENGLLVVTVDKAAGSNFVKIN